MKKTTNRRTKRFQKAIVASAMAMETTIPRKLTKREHELEMARSEGYSRGRSDAENAFRNEKAAREQEREKTNAKIAMMNSLSQAISSLAQALDNGAIR